MPMCLSSIATCSAKTSPNQPLTPTLAYSSTACTTSQASSGSYWPLSHQHPFEAANHVGADGAYTWHRNEPTFSANYPQNPSNFYTGAGYLSSSHHNSVKKRLFRAHVDGVLWQLAKNQPTQATKTEAVSTKSITFFLLNFRFVSIESARVLAQCFGAT